MEKIRKRTKGFMYNTCPELRTILAWAVIDMIICVSIFNREYSIIVDILLNTVMVLAVTLMVAYFFWLKRKNKGLSCFLCCFSLLKTNCVWINMKSKCVAEEGSEEEKDLKKKFVKELGMVLKLIPKGTICYCTTHERIVKKIVRMYPNAEVTEAYKKDLSKLKKKFLSKEKQKSVEEDIVTFYAVKFVR